MMHKISFTLNGEKVEAEVSTTTNLLTLLRETLEFTGTKFGCEQGNCGACTVHIDGEVANSCLVLGVTVDGREVTTIEGIGTPEQPHPLQVTFTEHYGAQCGFCTPGMIMSAVALLEENKSPSREDIVEAIVGNVCRCTGYAKIIDSVQAAAEMMK
jgi:carbon-monoxide dehydrogenase small subunit